MNDKPIKVSVYCITYNHEEYIRNALDGFVMQKTSFDFEVIVHDDASTDKTAQIIREYEEKYPNIIKPIYQTENQHSKGIDKFAVYIYPKMSGEYIAICEGDDYWTDENKLQMQVDFLDAHPEYSGCVHDSYQLDMRTDTTSLINGAQEDYDVDFSEVVQGGNCCYQMSSLLYRRKYATNRPEFFAKAKIFGDYPLSIYLVLEGKVRFFARTMSTYRYMSPNSWTARQDKLIASKNVDRYNYAIAMLRSVDEYTNHKYKKIIKKTIRTKEYIRDRIIAGRTVLKFKYIPIYFEKLQGRLKRKS